jgi:hypothetical protein
MEEWIVIKVGVAQFLVALYLSIMFFIFKQRNMTKKNPKKIVNTSININGKENLIKLQNSVETNKMTLTYKSFMDNKKNIFRELTKNYQEWKNGLL